MKMDLSMGSDRNLTRLSMGFDGNLTRLSIEITLEVRCVVWWVVELLVRVSGLSIENVIGLSMGSDENRGVYV